MSFTGAEGNPVPHEHAQEWTKTYRDNNPGQILGQFFGCEILHDILAQEGCKGIRFYYGVNKDTPVLVAVGADHEENDQITARIVADEGPVSPPRGGEANILNS